MIGVFLAGSGAIGPMAPTTSTPSGVTGIQGPINIQPQSPASGSSVGGNSVWAGFTGAVATGPFWFIEKVESESARLEFHVYGRSTLKPDASEKKCFVKMEGSVRENALLILQDTLKTYERYYTSEHNRGTISWGPFLFDLQDFMKPSFSSINPLWSQEEKEILTKSSEN